MCFPSARAELPDIREHDVLCDCLRCHTARRAGALGHQVSLAMMAASRAGREEQADQLCDALELLNHVAVTGVYPQIT